MKIYSGNILYRSGIVICRNSVEVAGPYMESAPGTFPKIYYWHHPDPHTSPPHDQYLCIFDFVDMPLYLCIFAFPKIGTLISTFLIMIRICVCAFVFVYFGISQDSRTYPPTFPPHDQYLCIFDFVYVPFVFVYF